MLLIGTNDWAFGVSEVQFRNNYIQILDAILAKIENNKKLILLTIPDFSVVPGGEKWSKGRNISEGVAQFNSIIESEANKRDLLVIDLFEISQQMENDPTLIFSDQFHPFLPFYYPYIL